MGKLRLVEKGSGYMQKLNLPDFYMNDFSVLGLIVNGVEEAAGVLKREGYTLETREDMTWVCFDQRSEMHHIVSLLAKNKIPGSLSDIVSCAYQG